MNLVVEGISRRERRDRELRTRFAKFCELAKLDAVWSSPTETNILFFQGAPSSWPRRYHPDSSTEFDPAFVICHPLDEADLRAVLYVLATVSLVSEGDFLKAWEASK